MSTVGGRWTRPTTSWRGMSPVGQKTKRRGGVSDQKPCYCDEMRDEREEAHRRRGETAKAGNPSGASRSAYAWQKKRRENGRKRILGAHLNDALKKGEARDAHRLSRIFSRTRNGSKKKAPIQNTRQIQFVD